MTSAPAICSDDLHTAADWVTSIHSATDAELDTELAESILSTEVRRARFLVALGEFDARGLAESRGAVNIVVYLARHHGQSRRAAQDIRTTARRLHAWPRVAAHMLTGALTYSKAKLILRRITEENQDELIGWALSMTCEELAIKLTGLARSDEEEPVEEDYARCFVDPDTGRVRLQVSVGPALGAELLAALKVGERLQDGDLSTDESPLDLLGPLREGLAETEEDERRPYHCSLSPEEILPPLGERDQEYIAWADYQRGGDYAAHQAWADDGGPCHDEDVDPPTPGQPRPPVVGKHRDRTRFGPAQGHRLLASLMTLVRSALLQPRSAVRAPGAEINVIVDADGQPRLPHQPGTTREDLVSLILNGAMRVHLRNVDGVTIEMTKSTRVVPAATEHAVLVASGHRCSTPGCGHQRFLQLHHIEPFAEGGLTNTRNLVALCSGCHSLVTDGLLTIHIDKDPRLLHFRMPNGKSFTSVRRGLPTRNPDVIDHYEEGPVPVGDEDLAPPPIPPGVLTFGE
ncbi:HNH endonuclease [Corynebacterium guangdongense]|uniref:HNH nuclease domain-containing protein n=1 Tax=Corynebacterium guangdongense TaxID=1783348 RepID=A0ABU1ZYH2_9CORY|nr:HNH endonuclease signature motif containing protein [Corynebacterium guangdongense]MDR7329443.1 hypothetical protein [Corynebacterium guangdongense]WJZ18008.1 HNH endonuclease [Corynebacterium guangdongense]